MGAQEALAAARALQSQWRWSDAEAELRSALDQMPLDPGLCAELGVLLCLSAREDEAARFMKAGASGARGAELMRTLAHHFHCRKLAAKRLRRPDTAAEAGYKRACSLAKQRGVELKPLPGIRLSACLIVRDEEAHLASCLDTLKGIADEVVVVDTGSRDGTAAIAASHGANVGHFEWRDDFSAARNHALSLATGDWVLWIDADERLEIKGQGALLSALVRPHFGGYTIAIINYLHEDESRDQVQHRPCRLFRRLDGVRFEGRVHEQIAPSILRLGLPIALLDDVAIRHYGYRRSEVLAKGKSERTIALLRRELADNPNDAFHWFNLGNALFTENRWEEAAECCAIASRGLEPGIPHGQFCHQLWALTLTHMARFPEALGVCAAADEAGFGGQLVEYARALALKQLGTHEEALAAIRKALLLELGPAETGDRSIGVYKARFLEGQILAALGQSELSLEAYRQVLESVPSFAPARLSLALELRRRGRHEEALREAELAIEDPGDGPVAAEMAALCAKELGRLHEAARVRETAWRSRPDDRGLWLAWAQAAEQAEDWPTAVRAYAEFSERFEPEAGVLINAGRALKNVRRYELALGCFEAAAFLEPQNVNAYMNAGDLLYACGKFEDAALAYSGGLKLDEQHADAWFMLGNALYKTGATDGALLAFERALSLEPGHEKAAHNLQLVRDEIRELAS